MFIALVLFVSLVGSFPFLFEPNPNNGLKVGEVSKAILGSPMEVNMDPGDGWHPVFYGASDELTLPVLVGCAETETWLIVTDVLCVGDRFAVYSDDQEIGMTGGYSENDFDCSLYYTTNPSEAYVSGHYSTGKFKLDPGLHHIRLRAVENPFGSGLAFVRLDVINSAVGIDPSPPLVMIDKRFSSSSSVLEGDAFKLIRAPHPAIDWLFELKDRKSFNVLSSCLGWIQAWDICRLLGSKLLSVTDNNLHLQHSLDDLVDSAILSESIGSTWIYLDGQSMLLRTNESVIEPADGADPVQLGGKCLVKTIICSKTLVKV